MVKGLFMFNFLLRKSSAVLFALIFFCFASINAQDAKPTPAAEIPKGKAPIIIIPGLTGSELVNKDNEELVWFRPQRAKEDDLRLPISPNLARNRDSIVPRDIIRKVEFLKFLPEQEIYEKLINGLEKRGGYVEGKWDNPNLKGYEDTFYVFPYDWRRDNVENARLLVQQVEALKRKLRRPNLKFNIIAHSMGGLIARYAAMYGNADLPVGKPKPTWAGARNFSKVFLLGTPNEGSVQALDSLLNGFSLVGGGLNLPFVQNLSKFDVFTIPSIYQLLPHAGTLTAYDENLKPIEIDIFDAKTWETYNWDIIGDEDFPKKFSAAEQKVAKAYFLTVLSRAKRFQDALNANTSEKTPVSMYLLGGDCKDTLNSIVLLRDEKKNRWKTLFKADSFERADKTKVTSEELKKVIYAMGDGVVTKHSLAAETLMQNGASKTVLPVTSSILLCEGHTKLVTAADSQDKLFSLLLGEASETKAQK
jgi:pimeloyl-ACP methyl ester carboxylesterase